LFYTTFPEARDAAYNAALEQCIYSHLRPSDYPSSHQPLEYGILNELDISSTSVSFRCPTQDPQPHIDHSQGLHAHQPLSHYQNQPSYYSSPRPVSFFLNFFLFERFSTNDFARLNTRHLYIFRLIRHIIISIHRNHHRSTSLSRITSLCPNTSLRPSTSLGRISSLCTAPLSLTFLCPSPSICPTRSQSPLEDHRQHFKFTNYQIHLQKLTPTSRIRSAIALLKALGMISVNLTVI
jgi:hypothetical protein